MKCLQKTFSALLLLALTQVVLAQTVMDLTFTWKQPTQRENGTALAATEIGGYEINYKKVTDPTYTVAMVPKGSTTLTVKSLPKADYTVLVATYDTNGLYSSFIPVTYNAPSSPNAPSDLKVTAVFYTLSKSSSSSSSATPGTIPR
jgi:hypothetical protein